MKAIAQALTYKEIRAIWNALCFILEREEPLPLATESMETAFEKVERVIEDTYPQRPRDIHFIVVPVELEEINKE